MGYRWTVWSTRSALAGAAFAISACAATDPHVAAVVAGVDEVRLMGHVRKLCDMGPRHASRPGAIDAALEYLEGELRAFGFDVTRENFTAKTLHFTPSVDDDGTPVLLGSMREGVHTNLIATLPGTARPERIVEIGAHFDSVYPSPGADDNASGVAAVLEIARAIGALGPQASTLRVCLFNLEEVGLLGSEAHVREIQARGDEVAAMINFEMVGYASHEPGSQRAPSWLAGLFLPDTADFVLVAGAFSSGWLGNGFEGAIDRYVPELPYASGNRMAAWFADSWRSDHASYWHADIPAIMISDTSEFRNQHYHRKSDTADTLDTGFLAAVTRAGVAATLELLDDS